MTFSVLYLRFIIIMISKSAYSLSAAVAYPVLPGLIMKTNLAVNELFGIMTALLETLL